MQSSTLFPIMDTDNIFNLGQITIWNKKISHCMKIKRAMYRFKLIANISKFPHPLYNWNVSPSSQQYISI